MSMTRPLLLLLPMSAVACWGATGVSHVADARMMRGTATRLDWTPPHDAACAPGQWSAPIPVTMSDARPVFVEAPRPVAVRDKILLFGQPVFVWATRDVFADTLSGGRGVVGGALKAAGVAIDRTGRATPLERPRGTSTMLDPLAMRGRADTVHVVWATSADTSGRRTYSTDLWYASFDGRQWSSPEHVVHARQIYWGGTAARAEEIDGRLFVVAGAADDANGISRDGTIVLRREAGQWKASWISTNMLPASRSVITADSGGRLFVAFIASIWERRQTDSTSLYVVRSTDGGASWSAPERVAPYRSSMIGDLAMVRARRTIHVFWNENPANSSAEVGHATLGEGSSQWVVQPTITGPHAFGDIRAAAIGGSIFLIGREADSRSLDAISVGATASAIAPIAPLADGSVPELAAVGRDSLMATWGLRRPHAYPMFPGVASPITQVAILTTHCR